jgi:hypothetical protein
MLRGIDRIFLVRCIRELDVAVFALAFMLAHITSLVDFRLAAFQSSAPFRSARASDSE